MKKIQNKIGLAGVEDGENTKARIMGRYFSFILMGAVFWLAFQWYLEVSGEISIGESKMGNFVVWLVFVIETWVLTRLVDNKKRYLWGNWLNILIILVGIPFFFIDYSPFVTLLRGLRVLLVIGLAIPMIGVLGKFLTDSRLDTTIAAAVAILVLAGVIITGIDPGIETLEDGIWWAWVTISTVGYGDVVPVTTAGRLFAGLLILLGMGLFSVITANFTALFVQRNKKENEDFIHESLLEIKERLARLENEKRGGS